MTTILSMILRKRGTTPRKRERKRERERTRNKNTNVFGYVDVYEHVHVHVSASIMKLLAGFTTLLKLSQTEDLPSEQYENY